MGVPTFYRWLCSRYPRVVQDVKDDLNSHDVDMNDEESFALALLSPNPNGEFDNLYVDMNGLIHPCCHPEGLEQPPSEEVMFQCIFDYLDRLFYLIRPRKLLYLAIDGVAPRAKMNQQRSRRFKSAAEADLEAETYAKVAAEFAAKNVTVPPKEERWDSNVITPGTPFMHELSRRIVSFIEERRRVYESWARIHVIYSDANTPGEGEHKIMNFVRNQRHAPQYDPNTKHVLHGMDADLIMLGLATHEVNFYIVREIVSNLNPAKKPEQEIRKQIMSAKENPLAADTKLKSDKSYRSMLRQNWKPMQFLRLPVLREYLSHQLSFPGGWASGAGPIDFERCIDDLVLMCFFCGNDFLPHLPSVSIPGGSIDQMILLYQNLLPELGDYLTNEGEINMPQVDRFVAYIAKVEDQVFRSEQEFKKAQKARRMQQAAAEQRAHQAFRNGGGAGGRRPADTDGEPSPANGKNSKNGQNGVQDGEDFDVGTEFKKRCAELLKEQREVDDPKEPIDLSLADPRLWKDAYYRQKFNLGDGDDVAAFASNVAANYVKGMCWVLRYYYQGCASWGWYYPFHYAPFCSDLRFQGLEFVFEHGEPFTPYQQLMSVMPIRSSHCLPPALRGLMTSSDSPIADFYPTKFREDPNGKRYKYQWVALLPFIDETKLLSLLRPLEAQLPPEFQERNCVKRDMLFAGRGGTDKFVGEVTQAPGHLEFTSRTEQKHRSKLLVGAVVPSSLLRIEDLMEDGRNRGFNCDGAKRMITNALGRGRGGGGGGRDDRRHDKDRDVVRNFNRDFHQTQNQYSTSHHPSAGGDARRREHSQHGGGYGGYGSHGAHAAHGGRHSDPYNNHAGQNARTNYNGAHHGRPTVTSSHHYPAGNHHGDGRSPKHGRTDQQPRDREHRHDHHQSYGSHESQYRGRQGYHESREHRFDGGTRDPRRGSGGPYEGAEPPRSHAGRHRIEYYHGSGNPMPGRGPNYLAGYKLERPRGSAPPGVTAGGPPPPPPPPPPPHKRERDAGSGDGNAHKRAAPRLT